MRRVIYIGGAARSGSSLLGEILGAQPGVLNVGELSLFWWAADRGDRCACGEPIRSCQLWGTVLEKLRETHGVHPREYGQLARARAALAHTTRPQRLMKLRSQPEAMSADERRLVEATEALMDTALVERGASVVVDSSKTLAALLFHQLCQPVDLRFVHLVRDPRAVVASTVRSRGVTAGNAESLPPGGSAVTGVVRWSWMNLTAGVGARMVPRRVRFSYESLMADPESVVQGLCRFADVNFDSDTLEGRQLRLPTASHAAVGNPGRGGRIQELHEDDRWRHELPFATRQLVTVGTWPVRAVMQ